MPDLIAEDMTDNDALRSIVAELRAQNEALLGRYTSIIGAQDQAVTASASILRAANDLAIKTVVTNQGANILRVLEGGFLVAILQPQASWVSPLTGKGQITCIAPSGNTTAAIATYLKASA